MYKNWSEVKIKYSMNQDVWTKKKLNSKKRGSGLKIKARSFTKKKRSWKK
jgi:hypothetical protein